VPAGPCSKRPEALTDDQSATLRKLRRRGGDLWRAYSLKESFRAIFAGDLNVDEAADLLDGWVAKASRSRLAPVVKAARTVRKYRDGILAALRLGINNGRAEGLNRLFPIQSASRSRARLPQWSRHRKV